jgi:acetyltransferase
VRKGLDTLEEARLPLFRSLRSCAVALGAAREYRTLRERPGDAPPGVPALRVPGGAGPLPWVEVRRLLTDVGIAMAHEVVVRSEAEARAAVAGLGYPVVVKLLGPLHKTEAGGVRLGLPDAAAVLTAVRELLPRGEACVIQPMLDGVEVLVGALRDPVLGPFVILAPGGIHADLYGERAMRPAPLSRLDAEAMLAETPALAALLAGYRGRAPGDRGALLEIMICLSELAAGLGPRLAEIDLNPVMVGRAGATTADARIILEAADDVS